MMSRLASFLERHSTAVGVAIIVLTVALTVGLFNRQRIETTLGDHEQIRAAFDRGYRLDPYGSDVKVAGVVVGTVTDVQPRGSDVVVTMTVERGTRKLLGTAPAAEIRPKTLLGGNYYVALVGDGGDAAFAGEIPVDRTTIPVELDAVLEVLQEDARDGAVTAISQLDQALSDGGAQHARGFLEVAPGTLAPATGVLEALQGREPDDLTNLVADLESVTDAMTHHPDELERLLASAGGTARLLEATSVQQQELLDGLAATLRTTRTGMTDLEGSLARLRTVAGPLQPSISELGDVLVRAEPVLDEALPVVRDLRLTAADLRPVVSDLRPVVGDAQSIVQEVQGPVLSRLNDVIVPSLNDTYRDENELLRQELGYMFAALAGISQYTDANGPAVSFQPGVGIETLSGNPVPFPRLFGEPRDPEPEEASR